jgi:SAM-dependent methyltransferase
MEKFYNIEEQRQWNDKNMWDVDGHEWSVPFESSDKLWNDYIFDYVKEFRGKKVLEIAPGFGRMTQYLSILASQLVVVDLNQTCIDETRRKLGNHVLAYFVNDGKSLSDIRTSSQDLVFSFDSFVHMHGNVIEEYVKEINRVLVSGGYGFVHHSWLYGGQEESFKNIAGRSNMTPERFKELVEQNGMEIVSQKEFHFPTVTDCISFFKKK